MRGITFRSDERSPRGPRVARWSARMGVMVWVWLGVACDAKENPAQAPIAAVDSPARAPADPPPASPSTKASTANEAPAPTPTPAGDEAANPAAPAAPSAAPNADAAATPTPAAPESKPDAAGSNKPDDTAPAAPALTKVLLLGDSMIATGFGVRLESFLDQTPGVVAYRKGKSASGLARPDFFDWQAEGRQQALDRKPDVVVVMLGGNDGQDLTSTGKSKRRVRWGSDAWRDAYAARIDKLLSRLWAPGRIIVWLGLPKMGMASLERKLTLIREIQQARVEAHPGGVYLETTPFLLNNEGELKVYGEVRGKRKALRADDGIHFTMAGSTYFAQAVLDDLLTAFGYEAPAPDNADPAPSTGSG